MKSEFSEKVNRVVRGIPEGKTLSYKDVAKKAGAPRSWRAVGNVLNKNFNPEIPCHRVIKSNGEPGGYNRGREEKIRRLKRERRDLF